MRARDGLKAAISTAAAGAIASLFGLAALTTPSREAIASTGCDALAAQGSIQVNTTFIGLLAPWTIGTYTLAAGDVITFGPVTSGGVSSLSITGASISLSTTSGAVSQTVAADTTVTLTGNATTTATNTNVRITCVSARSATAAPAVQLALNAQSAITFGQQALQNYNDWTTRAIISSFDVGHLPAVRTAHRPLQSLRAIAKAAALKQEESRIVDDLAELRDRNATTVAADDGQIVDLERKLAAIRRSLAFARLDAEIARDGRTSSPTDLERGSGGSPQTIDRRGFSGQAGPVSLPLRESALGGSVETTDGVYGRSRQEGSAPSVHLNARDLGQYCDDACDVLGRRLNAWLEAKMFSANDSLVQSNSSGFVISGGGDYKLLSWLAIGLSGGVESFRTNYGTNLGTTMTGFTAEPYLGVKLDDNVFASAFVGLSSLTYNSSPASTVTAQFTALRLFFGGALTGLWRDGPWRFQPGLSGQYGSEAQYGYTDSAANNVPGQTVTYGRVSAGPEIGYTIKDVPGFVSIEPFLTAKANLDFASNTIALFNGTPLVVRPGTIGSGTVGLGLSVQFESGIYFRVQGAYESIGVTGLDIWSGQLRGGLQF